MHEYTVKTLEVASRFTVYLRNLYIQILSTGIVGMKTSWRYRYNVYCFLHAFWLDGTNTGFQVDLYLWRLGRYRWLKISIIYLHSPSAQSTLDVANSLLRQYNYELRHPFLWSKAKKRILLPLVKHCRTKTNNNRLKIPSNIPTRRYLYGQHVVTTNARILSKSCRALSTVICWLGGSLFLQENMTTLSLLLMGICKQYLYCRNWKQCQKQMLFPTTTTVPG